MTDSLTVAPLVRSPLGLPRGSVRALLALSVFGSTMGLLALGKNIEQGLWLINYVMLGYYFAARQGSSAVIETTGRQPLGLPRGTVRWMLILSFVGTSAYVIWTWTQSGKSILQQPAFFPMFSLASFFLGRLVKRILAPFLDDQGPRSLWAIRFQDLKALTVLFSALCVILFCLLPPSL